MNKLKFSIIISTYNRADFIVKTINSVLNQTYANFELIVVDDGSIDNTEELVLAIKDDRIKYYKKKNEERAVARNFGANKAIGDYITFLDSDDIAYNNHFQVACNLINQRNNPEVFHLAYDWATQDAKVFKKENNFSGDINKQLIKGNLFSCNGVFVRKDIILKNQFNEDRDLSASEDWELWLRLAVKYKWYYSNIVTSQIIDHDQRSVFSINKDALIKRKELFLKYTLENSEVVSFIGKYKNGFIANAYSYIALHLVLAKYKKEGFKYFKKALKTKISIIFQRRSWAIIKRLFL